MGQDSKIEWTHHTFNPWRGCTKVSEGCKHCYADTLSKRNPKTLGVWGPSGTRVAAADAAWGEVEKWNRQAANGVCVDCGTPCIQRVDAFDCECGQIGAIGKTTRPRVFCASLADVFEGQDTMPSESWPVVQAARRRLFDLICRTPNLDWLLLTKRPENALRMMVEAGLYAVANPALPCPQPNLWIGTSVENQKAADERIPHLLKCPAAVRFLSAEPLLDDIDLRFGDMIQVDGESGYLRDGIDWVIGGGESGPSARPMHPDWARSLRDQCVAAGVSFFFKQWGAFEPVTPLYDGRDDAAENGRGDLDMVDTGGRIWGEGDGQPNDMRTWLMERVGKKAAGRTLDGREWSEFPTATVPA